MKAFVTVHGVLERLALWAVWVGGAALLLAAIMVTLDVLSRKYLSVTMSGSDEITGYVFAGSTTWAYAYCLLHRSNIRIDALYNILPLPVRAVLDIVGLLLLQLYMGYLTSKAVDVFVDSWVNDSVSVTTLLTPLWIPQLVWLTGLLFFNITLVFLIVYAILSYFVGGAPAVQRLTGTLSVQEEIAEETAGVKEMEK